MPGTPIGRPGPRRLLSAWSLPSPPLPLPPPLCALLLRTTLPKLTEPLASPAEAAATARTCRCGVLAAGLATSRRSEAGPDEGGAGPGEGGAGGGRCCPALDLPGLGAATALPASPFIKSR